MGHYFERGPGTQPGADRSIDVDAPFPAVRVTMEIEQTRFHRSHAIM
jgi:hypothetical protein